MKKSLQKFVIFFFALLISIEPILQLSQISGAKAADINNEEPLADVPYNGSPVAQPAGGYTVSLQKRATNINVMPALASIHSEDDQKAGIGLEEALANQVTPRIILNGDDQQAIKIYWRLSGTWMMPDFEREPQTIWEQYPKFKARFSKEKSDSFAGINKTLGHDIASLEDITTLKTGAGHAYYLDLAQYARVEWSADLGDVPTAIKKVTFDAMTNKSFLLASYADMLSDVTGETVETINQIFKDNAAPSDPSFPELALNAKIKYDNLMTTFDENIKAIKLDSRVLNLLVYLVTPKTQGGAGHYKIKVKRILSGYTAPKKIFSRESDTIYNSGTADNSSPATAADYGQLNGITLNTQNSTTSSTMIAGLNDDDPAALAVVSDQDGSSYNTFVSSALAASPTDAAVVDENTKNISAHSDGQAVDISEIDDIRCTLIKKRRIGGDSKTKFLQRPIKLAWQTSQGYAENGGGDLYKSDMANVLKSYANDSIKELVSEFGGDISSFDGDLSSAGFSDVAMLIGKSIFAQIINSPGADLQGYNFGDTLTQLGGMYMADYLGLPREMFTQGQIPNSYDEMAQRIGTAAIEKRLALPIGTFGGSNLKEMLQKAGQRKMEEEMNLSAGALDNYYKQTATEAAAASTAATTAAAAATAASTAAMAAAIGDPTNTSLADTATTAAATAALANTGAIAAAATAIANTTAPFTENKQYLVGKAILEQALNLPQGSFTGKNGAVPSNFAELKGSLSEIKTNLIFRDPVYTDNLLHIDLGTTEKLTKDVMTPYDFVSAIGNARKDQTVYGFQFMAAKDSAYELDNGTFLDAINGRTDALVKIGIKSMAKVFTTGNDEREAFILWVNANMTKTTCNYDDPVKVTIASGKVVTISEKKATDVGLHSGDMFDLFSCASSNPSAVFHTVGSKILRDSLIQYYLTPEEKVKFNLTEINHTFHSSDPDKQFYIKRITTILDSLEQIKANWKNSNKDPEYQRMKKTVDAAYASINTIFDQSQLATTITQAKTSARDIAVNINKLKSDVTTLRMSANRYIQKTNATIIDINKIVRAVSEILAGEEIASTDTTTLQEIPANAFVETPDTTVNSPALNKKATNSSSDSTLIGLAANKQTFMLLLSGKMRPADFFLILACDKVENSLDLPQNSLIYFVQNYEKKGLGTIESFYSAVGQAKIEETLHMPSKYFQGPLLTDPGLSSWDFKNDLSALYEYLKYDIDSEIDKPKWKINPATLKNPLRTAIEKPFDVSVLDQFKDDGTVDLKTLTPEQQESVKREDQVAKLAVIKKNDPKTFDGFVNKANKLYAAQMKDLYAAFGITNAGFENNVKSITANIKANGLTDGIRTEEQDLLFRMGFSGSSLDALVANTSVAWLNASGRANQLDKLFDLPSGSTKALFTGDNIASGTGINAISTKDKQILVAKMGISPVAIDKLLQFLNGEIPIKDLTEAKAVDITNLGENPYLGSSSDTCNTSVLTQDKTTGQMISSAMIPNSWFYFDKTITIGTRVGQTFGSQVQAEKYSADHTADQVTYLDELAYGLAKVSYDATTYRSMIDFVKGQITNFLTNPKSNNDLVNKNNEITQSIEKNLGVTSGTLQKLFTISHATAAEVPLVTYKRAVGVRVVTRTINSKIFNALGIKLDPSLFSGNEFFEIMQGNFSSLWGIAGSMVDQKLGIPSGSTMKILTAKSSALRTCAVSEIGGSIIGKFVGLDYVSLSGNIYENVGRSRLEKMLGLAHNSFSGNDINQLIENVGPVNFYLAFKYPVGETGQPVNGTESIDLWTPLSVFYSPDYANSLKNFSAEYKLQKIKEFLDINTNLSANAGFQKVYINLKNQLIQHVKDTSTKAVKDGDWRNSIWGVDKKDEVIAYLNRIDTIDNTFGVAVGTTAVFIAGGVTKVAKTVSVACNVQDNGSVVPDPDNAGRIRWDHCQDVAPGKDIVVNPYKGPLGTDPAVSWNADTFKIPAPLGGGCECKDVKELQPVYELTYESEVTGLTPDLYIKKVSDKTLLGVGLASGMNLFDFDMTDAQKQAVVGIVTHYGNWVKEGDKGYAKLYDGLSTIFSLHLDAKAGLQEGTIKRMIENPNKIADILLPQAARKIDEQLGLNSGDRWSVSGVYQRYFNSAGNHPDDPHAVKDANDCGTEQAAIDAKELDLAKREKDIEDWMDSQYGMIGTIDSASAQGAGIIPGYNLSDNPEYVTKVIEPKLAINEERAAVQSQKDACKAKNRFGNPEDQTARSVHIDHDVLTKAAQTFCKKPSPGDVEMCQEINQRIADGNPVVWKFAWMIITDFASDKISEQIDKYTEGTLHMPTEDIKHFFFNGDMRYFTAALFSYGVNTYLDNNNTNASGKRQPMPQAWQISYDMVKLWIVGDSESENYAANAAASAFFDTGSTTPDYEQTLAPMGYGDVFNYDYGSGGFFSIFGSQQFDIQAQKAIISPSSSANRTNLVQFSKAQSDTMYNTNTLATAVVQDNIKKLNDEATACQNTIKTSTDQNAINACHYTISQQEQLGHTMQQAKDDARSRFGKQVQYRVMDATFWSKDHNIFPGFSYAMLEGSGAQKNVAIGLYIRNGLISGQFFGQDIGFLKTIEDAAGMNTYDLSLVIKYGAALAGGKPADEVLADFKNSGGLTEVSKFISVHSEKWFGFEIDQDYAQGLMVGITTGQWGLTLGNKEHNFTDSRDGKQYKFDTLGQVFVNKTYDSMVNKAFSWADRQTGWKSGTALAVFSTGKKVFKMVDNIKKLTTYKNLQESLGDFKTYADNNPDIAKLANDNKGGTEGAIDGQKQEIVLLAADLFAKSVQKWVDQQIGKKVGQMEEKFGLVQNSTYILVDAVVGWGVSNAAVWIYNQVFAGASANMAFLGPSALVGALIMFIGVNLFGFYKTEMRCSADGYYPEIESPSVANDSTSGLGVWDGMNEEASKTNTIAAAQYKAKRLILDVLNMHKNPLYKDTFASQIMTGRNEDVLAVNDSINENMCSVIGLVAIGGICGGNTRLGVWENLQTATYTHIGF